MSKDAYYFSHDCNARNDAKILKLRMKMGMEGYGIYWALVEMLREEESNRLDLDHIDAIAFDLRVNEEKIIEVIKGFGLFRIKGKKVGNDSLDRRIKEYKEKSQKRAEAGRKGGLKSAAKRKQSSSKIEAMLKQNSSNAQALKESKVKEIKEKEIKGKGKQTKEKHTEIVRAREEPTLEIDLIQTGALIDRMKEPWDALHRQLCDSPQKWEGRAERALVEIRKNITARPGVDNDEKILEIWEFILNARDHWPEWNARPENMKLHLVASQFDSIWAGIKAKGQAKKKTTNPTAHEWGEILDKLKNGKK